MPDERLRSVPIFAALAESDLEQISAATTQERLRAGERLFEEGDDAREAYVIVEGELEILKKSSEREVLLAVRGPGDVIGEMSLLENSPRMAGAKARTDVTLLSIPRAAFDKVLSTSAAAVRGLFGVLLARWRETESRLRQREQLAQLGTLSAGLAHELNNPAAAAKRAIAGFHDAAKRLATVTADLQSLGLDTTAHAISESLAEAGSQRLGSLARSDREEVLLGRLKLLGVVRPSATAAVLADAQSEVVDKALADLDDIEQAAAIIEVGVARREVASLTSVALDASRRISDIVGAVKSYAFTGQAPVQDVDLARMLDDTLMLLNHKLADIEIERDYEAIPTFEAFGSELNQVWTNLIDNAVDAIAATGRVPGRIVLRVRTEDGYAIVEVEDDGPGIPDEILPRVFDSFFTTKPPGSGTGLGLDISYAIVAQRHGGEIDIDSEPGRTTVRVRIPMGDHVPGS